MTKVRRIFNLEINGLLHYTAPQSYVITEAQHKTIYRKFLLLHITLIFLFRYYFTLKLVKKYNLNYSTRYSQYGKVKDVSHRKKTNENLKYCIKMDTLWHTPTVQIIYNN